MATVARYWLACVNEVRSFAGCDRTPDKETPLWAPDLAPIYDWTADAYNAKLAYYVSYNGAVQVTLKAGGLP